MELENQLAFGSGWETIEIWDAEHVDDDGKEWEGPAGPHGCCARTSLLGQDSLKEHLCPKGMSPVIHQDPPAKALQGNPLPEFSPALISHKELIGTA